MIEKQTIWQDALGELAEDLFDLFLSPLQPFPENVSYPATPGMEALINDRFDSLYLPDRRLVHLVERIDENWAEQYERRLADWTALFEWEVLKGFGNETAFASNGAGFEGLRQLAGTWGAYLAQVMGRVLTLWEMYEAVGDMVATVFRQLPAKELGEAMREFFTPGYLKAHASVKYVWGLSSEDRQAIREAEEILQASDADLSREIDTAMSGISSVEMGTYMKRFVTEIATFWGELVSSEDFRQKLPDTLPFAFQWVAWYMGYCFRQHLQNNPPRAKRVLEAIGSRKEADAVMEEYRWLHGWGGDRDKAVELGWQSVARKYFRINGRIDNITEDEDQEKLIGVANALEGYCGKNPAIVGLMDGVSGGVEAYLAKAGTNRAKSWCRSQRTDGNRVLTEAKHPESKDVADKCSLAADEIEELSDDEILSRLRERYHPSADPVVQEMEAKDSSIAWYRSLTEKEKTAVNLAAEFDTEEEIAEEMGISQQRVSQLLGQALRKYRKLCQ